MNKSVKTFVELDHQYNPDENLHQSDANMIFKTGEQSLHLLAFKQ